MIRSKALQEAQAKYRKNNITPLNFDMIKNKDIEIEILEKFSNVKSKKGFFIEIYESWKNLNKKDKK